MRLVRALFILGVADIVAISIAVAIWWADMPDAVRGGVLVGYLAGGFAIVAAYMKRVKDPPLAPTGVQTPPAIVPPTPPPPSIIPVPPEPYFAHRYFMPGNFTGRKAERKELTEWFTNGTEPMFVYEAIGGMGKSAVTWFWLHEDVLKSDPKPDGVIWWSFYEKESRFETFLEKAPVYVTQDEQKVKAVPSTYDRMELLRQQLCKKRYLIILDGAERILRAYAGLGSPYEGDEVPADKKDDYRACVDPNAGTFLQWLTSSEIKSKILITSRLFPKELDGSGGCRHKFLGRMDREDAVVFFQKQGIAGTRAEIEAACNAYGYHPLSLRLLSGLILKDPQYKRDIATWAKYNLLPDEKQKEHNILVLAYESLDEKKRNIIERVVSLWKPDRKKRKLISEFAAFRNPMDYDSIVIFQRDFKDQHEFDAALIDLVDRGLLLRDPTTNKYDLHPIVRRYCYDRLGDKHGVHSQLRDYFATVPEPDKIESLADLDPVIELYHHTVNSGRYDEACDLFVSRIGYGSYHRFGAHSLCIDLLRMLFPDSENNPPRLSNEADQACILSELANSYSLFGQPRKAISLMKRAYDLSERLGRHPTALSNLATSLSSLAVDQVKVGEIDSAESNFRKSISISQEVSDEFHEAVGRQGLGGLLTYRGKFEESMQELVKSMPYFLKIDHKQALGFHHSYLALRALMTSDSGQALEPALKARKLADAAHLERDIIRAEWLLGAAFLANGNLTDAENHLNEALHRDRRINLVEIEASILLELAKLRHAQKHAPEALRLADEALTIADRCEYRLQQAEIHNFLAQFYFNTGDKTNARNHAEIAKERAECGYVPALKQAEALLAKL